MHFGYIHDAYLSYQRCPITGCNTNICSSIKLYTLYHDFPETNKFTNFLDLFVIQFNYFILLDAFWIYTRCVFELPTMSNIINILKRHRR